MRSTKWPKAGRTAGLVAHVATDLHLSGERHDGDADAVFDACIESVMDIARVDSR